MKTNWFFILGVSFILVLLIFYGINIGSYVSDGYVDWSYLIAVLFLTGIPFVLGYFAGKCEVKP